MSARRPSRPLSSTSKNQFKPGIGPMAKINHLMAGESTSSINTVATSAQKFVTSSAKQWQRLVTDKQVRVKNQLNKSLAAKVWRKVSAWPLIRETTILIILLAGIALVYLMRDLPSPKRLTATENFAVSTQIFDRNGQLLYEVFGDENRIPIKLADLPPHVAQATIAIEDKNFYHHLGFDVLGITRAAFATLTGKRIEGGSTITQQLVKNALLTRERSLTRKAKEAILSVLTEVLYSKADILEMYLNYISYGGTSVGIEAASKSYFGKSAKDLTLAEAALLAGLPQAPSTYSPFGSNPERAKARQAEVLRRMEEDGYITAVQAEAAKAEVLHYALSKTDIQAPHFVFYVRDWLYEKFGEETVQRGGLRVTTTLDLDLQKQAQASLSAEVASLSRMRVSNGAALVTKPDTGEILAMIGSTDYFDSANDGQVNVTLALRQPGSSIKPIMYATAFEQKTLNPGTMLLDIPTCFKNPGQKEYCPKNYSGDFKGPISVRQSLGNSLNIPAVKGLYTIGVPTFMEQATKMGITTWTDPSQYGLSLTLGGGEVRMIDMATTFGTLANQGVKVPLTPILKIENYKGEKLLDVNTDQRKADLTALTDDEDLTEQGDLTRVMHRAPAYLVSHIMQDNTARVLAFGANSQLVFKGQVVSAKTGTTNDLKDNWTVGFTPKILTITWVGNNDSKSMSYLASGITGAAPIFHDIMSLLLKNQEPVWPARPDEVALGPVCPSGLPPQPGDKCSPIGTDLYWKASTPSASLTEKTNVWIHPETGLPLVSGESTDGLVLEERTIYSDPITKNYCVDCSRPVTDQGKVMYEKYVIDPLAPLETMQIIEPPTPDGQ
jgi:1A family penicillin-binding protein